MLEMPAAGHDVRGIVEGDGVVWLAALNPADTGGGRRYGPRHHHHHPPPPPQPHGATREQNVVQPWNKLSFVHSPFISSPLASFPP